MKFVAVIRQVPDGESKLRIQGDRVDLSGATMILDQMDEYAVEEAIRLKERHGGEAVVVGFGPERTEEAIRTALAMGMDRGVHVVYEGFADPVAVAEALVEVLKEEAPTLVLTGGQQADWDSQALGGALAEALGVPVVAWTTALELEGDTAKAKHDLDEGAEWVRVRLPAVFTTQQGLNEPRYPTLPGIMKAKKKEIRKVQASLTPKVTLISEEIQEKSRLGKILDGKDPVAAAEELVRLLHEEAKVI
ncbi:MULTISPECIES: electron transfer flavoprotein subunit beta/FixA family protein [Thermus]|jgi:electron transfer flavoprotein beta subunit|uniref:Electron transfer flavoprotein subunit beta n=1 Tax=Thermus thermophilus (strain ATCC 27634 / DSM 579 / HB8) TaxID=300852 RepID=Q5SJ69_THET8|nr:MULTISPECIES: electron transfer flavoprotein subunit beta/FixA family protein [Thermus]QZY57755.1 electron transfer flavoprotein subunit beta/FixA family protein [Thermus thermophilus]BAD70968.1 electron transfer flavoprotein, beta subunit [Thermus thermophilus HB8]BDA37765.1 electron transfer flavoprotein subunit beta [Thermus thermophilus]BDE45490.1 electron transfer flavoprotein subunit beta [Thermus thermophilus]HAH39327.1 electron transfer flavoprotein beta subunit/FixA family protein 